MTKTKATAEEQIERLRQLVIAARADPSVGPAADECVRRLNEMYQADPAQFTTENARWLNVLRGSLAVRLAAHAKPARRYTKSAKRKGDQLDHCWRCETPVDERFTELCPVCDSKTYHWRVCPVCAACGCQRAGTVLI